MSLSTGYSSRWKVQIPRQADCSAARAIAVMFSGVAQEPDVGSAMDSSTRRNYRRIAERFGLPVCRATAWRPTRQAAGGPESSDEGAKPHVRNPLVWPPERAGLADRAARRPRRAVRDRGDHLLRR